MLSATITSKGQVTIPKAVRDMLDLHKGDKIHFLVTKKGEVLIRPVCRRVDDVFGRLHKPGLASVSVTGMDLGIQKQIKDSFG